MLLRVIACFMVFMVHFGQRMKVEVVSPYLKTFTNFGAYGVQLFFIISGFLSFASKSKNVKDYYVKRMIRILPLYGLVILYFFVSETFIFNSIPVDTTGLYWWRYILLIAGNFKTGTYFWDNIGITWTIFVFATYYLAVPLIKKMVKSYNFSCVLLVFTLLLKLVVGNYFGAYLQTLTYFCYFAIGIVIYYAYNSKKSMLTVMWFSLLCIILAIYNKTNNGIFYSFFFGIIMLSSMKIGI